MGDLTEVIQHRLLPSPVTAQRSNGNPSPMVIGAESWAVAEREAERIISRCQPTVVSEEKRRDVIDYVQRLIRGYLGCEVFPYGSVPLKTYLPDGDIDLTAFGGANGEDMLADDIVSVLEAEEQNRAAEFIIKDVQLVRAEVKLVKCIVQNIVVDISFNQIGGLCTLCFLEQVDRLIGKNHIFKRSIILIKAWCYYQSRILGAHHGLISTYALETLVLYIFHVFHSTLDGPLAVLYKFLDYFSNFDWETYCISLTGPVRISSLPDIVVETPENGGGDLLLGSDFLRYCSDMFSVPLRGADMNSKIFPQKFLNIVDPLKENNNLGRSVSKGNFCRIRSAFAYGARKLGQILTHRVVDIAEELSIFFSSTLDRHGSGLRPDVQNPIPRSALSVYASAYTILEAKPCQYNNGSVQDVVETAAVMEVGITQNGRQSSFVDGVLSLEDEKYVDRNGFLGNRLTGKTKDISTSSFRGLKISNGSTKISPSNDEEIGSPLHMPPHAPHLYFSKSWLANRPVKNVDVDTNQSENFENKISSVMKDKVPSSIGSKSNQSDLRGDYDSHLMCLHYGRWWYKYASSVPVVTMPPPPPPSPFPGVSLWDPVPLPSQFKTNGFSQGNVNGFIHSSVVYPMNQMLISGVAVGSEEMTKHRGTGTYFPNPNRPPHAYRPSPVKGRNFGQPRSSSTKGRAIAFAEANMLERSNLEQLPESHFTVDQCLGSDIHQSYSQRLKQNLNANVYISQRERIAEHGPSDRHMPLRAPDQVSSRQPRLTSLNPQTTSQGSLAPTTQMPNHVPGSDRLMVQKSYHLKNEDDFPPLSS